MSKKPKKGESKIAGTQHSKPAKDAGSPSSVAAKGNVTKTRDDSSKHKTSSSAAKTTRASKQASAKDDSGNSQRKVKAVNRQARAQQDVEDKVSPPTPTSSKDTAKPKISDTPKAADRTKNTAAAPASKSGKRATISTPKESSQAPSNASARASGANTARLTKTSEATEPARKRTAKTTNEKVASDSSPEGGEELTFANSPFAASPHMEDASEEAAAPDLSDESPRKGRARNKSQTTAAGGAHATEKKSADGKRSKRNERAPRSPAKGEVIDEAEGSAKAGAQSHDAAEDTLANAQAAEPIAGDETVIDPVMIEADGAETTAEDEEGEEPGLFAAASQNDDDEREVLSEEEENRRYLKGILEALLFSSDKPLSGRELARAARIDKKRTLQLLLELRKEYRHRGVNIAEISGGFVLRSNPTYGAYVQKALALRPVRLSRAQLETLAIIAYRQPITRPEIDDIRGVDSGQVLKGLADRDLIKMLGKKDEAGRPMLYGTTDQFLELFSLESLKGLPSLREFTELSDDSKEKFAQVTGETMPSGEALGDEPSTIAVEGEGDGEDARVATSEEALDVGEGQPLDVRSREQEPGSPLPAEMDEDDPSSPESNPESGREPTGSGYPEARDESLMDEISSSDVTDESEPDDDASVF
jgi:segregation and condensation protein B